MCKKLLKNSQRFGKKCQKTSGGIFFDSHCISDIYNNNDNYNSNNNRYRDSVKEAPKAPRIETPKTSTIEGVEINGRGDPSPQPIMWFRERRKLPSRVRTEPRPQTLFSKFLAVKTENASGNSSFCHFRPSVQKRCCRGKIVPGRMILLTWQSHGYRGIFPAAAAAVESAPMESRCFRVWQRYD